MKKLLFIICLLPLLILGCNNKNLSGDDSSVKSNGQNKISKNFTLKPSVFIYSGWILYKEDPTDNCMVATANVSYGDVVSIFVSDDQIDQKTALRKLKDGTTDSFNFVRCSYNDEEYWTRDIFISPLDSKPAIVCVNENLFSQPDLLSMLTDKNSKMKVLDLVIITGTDGDYYSSVVYNGNPYGKEVFIPKTSVLDSSMAVEFSQIISKINENLNSNETKYSQETLDEVFTVILDDWNIMNKDATLKNIVINTVINSSFPISENIINRFKETSSYNDEDYTVISDEANILYEESDSSDYELDYADEETGYDYGE